MIERWRFAEPPRVGQLLATWTADDDPDDFWLCRVNEWHAATGKLAITYLERAGGEAGRPLLPSRPRAYELDNTRAEEDILAKAVACPVRAPAPDASAAGEVLSKVLVELTLNERRAIYNALYPSKTAAKPDPVGIWSWRPWSMLAGTVGRTTN